MNALNRLTVFALAAALLAASLCSCGKKTEITTVDGGGTEETTQEGTVAVWSEEVKDGGESVCDAGKISVTVPEGWKAFAVSDMMGDYNSEHNPNAINVYKGAINQLDTRSTPYIEIRYYSADSTEFNAGTQKDLYTEVIDIDPTEIGDRTWSGFSGVNGTTPVAVLTSTEKDGGKLVLTLFMNVNGSTISLEDEDVDGIISAITVKTEE
ncbi:MAG: hypothetical protein IJT91_08635 [Clostridia bacterium]|nr:hypothetical protein [Clostridia bacterium]